MRALPAASARSYGPPLRRVAEARASWEDPGFSQRRSTSSRGCDGGFPWYADPPPPVRTAGMG